MTHTPGPWAVEPKEIRDIAEEVCGVRSDWVAIYTDTGVIGAAYMLSEEQNEANARLIAAAPDLLAALESLIKNARLDNWDDEDFSQIEAWREAFRAVCKAKGLLVPKNMEPAP